MAKIALISRTLNPQVLSLAQALHHQGQEIQLITSKEQGRIENFEFSILAYFKKWSALEFIWFLPRFLKNSPEIFHFIFEESHEAPSVAHVLLLRLAETLGKVRVSSLGEIKINSKKWQQSRFLKTCQAISVPSREKLMFLKRQDLIEAHAICEVVLPLTESCHWSSAEQQLDHEQIRKWGPFILIPALPDYQHVELFAEICASALRPVFIGERSARLFADIRCTCVPPLAPESLRKVLTSCRAICLASHAYSVSELMLWQSYAEEYSLPLLVHRRQTEALPGLCLHEKNGFIIDNLGEDLRRIISQNPNLYLSGYQKRDASQITLDQSLNQLNRLYIQALSCH